MSIDWFRWYHGSISDPKFTVVARKSKQPRALVIAVWAAILESASQADDRGSVEDLEIDTIAACLDVDDEAVSAIYDAIVAKSLIVDGRVEAWDRRQVYREDDSAERVRRFREKQRKDKENNDLSDTVTHGNAQVTHGNAQVTPQITDTDTDTDQNRAEQSKAEKSVSPAQARPARPIKKPIPADLSITPELQAWADERGYREPLAAHLESFIGKATAKGYAYADWQAALRNAIRDDWAGLRKPSPIERAAPGGGRNGGREASDPRIAEVQSILSGVRRQVIEGECSHVAH